MLSVSVFLLAFCPAAAPPQQPAGGFERLVQTLEKQTLERRTAAMGAWTSLGQAYLEQPSLGTMSPLLTYAPYIQEPVLDALSANLQSGANDPVLSRNLLQLLGSVMNRGGAARLLPLIPQLPADQRALAVRYSIEMGGRRTRHLATRFLQAESADVRQSALESLLLHGDSKLVPALLDGADLTQLDLNSFGAVLEILGSRPDLPAEVRVPAAVYQQTNSDLLNGAIAFMAQYPQPDAEDFLTERALLPRNSGLSIEARKLALSAYESGSEAFRWRNGSRAMVRFLKDEQPGEATYAVAWTLHRLGDKSGRKYLLAGPEERAKQNPNDWRTQLALGRMQVDVSEFNSAYRTIKETFDAIEGTQAASRLVAEDFFYAARAAAGARHSKEAGVWLTATRYTPGELAPYRNLPEFEPFLKKPPFNHLFPVAD
jgi:hypothetical protein